MTRYRKKLKILYALLIASNIIANFLVKLENNEENMNKKIKLLNAIP